ncbi:MAG: hypothetical protein QOH06_4254 [Acidobacteriota bacterium]|jgi:hypothetical protein|nr:hypothetical protein [Acidobacteriota bacterium]
MWRKSVPLFLALLAFLAAAARGSAIVLDPQPGFDEYNAEAAVHPNGGVLLVWTRNQPDVPVLTAMAATLDPDTGQLGELHEWGAGSVDHVVPLGPGYLALRVDGQLFAQFLDEGGRPVGVAQLLGAAGFPAAAHSTPDGGAIVVTIVRSSTAAESVVSAWRFGPDGTVLSGPTELARNAIQAVLDMDAAGNLVLAWRSFGNAVYVRRFSPDLQPLSRILPITTSNAYAVRVVMAPDGRFVVIYSKKSALWAHAFRADASSSGKSAQIAPQGQRGHILYELDAAIGDQGRILAAWFGYATGAVPTIQARVLSPAGLPLTKIFRLAQTRPYVSGLQEPRVERLPDGDFLVLWTGVGENGSTLRFRRVSGR